MSSVVCTNSLDTDSQAYQLMVGTLLKSKFSDASQGPTLQADLFKYKQSGLLC